MKKYKMHIAENYLNKIKKAVAPFSLVQQPF